MNDLSSTPLKVEIEAVPASNFQDIQKELVSKGKRFTGQALHQIPYSQLHLCCIGSAGAAACSSDLVNEEKDHRIDRFLSLSPEELAKSERWLRAEGMYGDVISEISSKTVPTWDELTCRQQAVAKLLCIYNHVDNPHSRLMEACLLLRACSEGSLTLKVCSTLVIRLLALDRSHPVLIGGSELREGVWKVMETVFDLLSDSERVVFAGEQIRGYSCTSDCFRCCF
jgi:hypothetical protein